MRIFLAMALAASLFVAAGCSCATGTCGEPVCDPCGTTVVAPAPAPAAVVNCDPCRGL
ncbi:MAG: hypothetical protein LUC93_13725 [Planctomycetaceae bacterium]|nr:hypothetical protein [Planctomycetaceae bacterium]